MKPVKTKFSKGIVTAPKPFVFVLMPFDSSFNDIYKFGIKGAAEEAGAYAERVDEQIFTEGILERVFNQINKADVVVADMTGRNPNVFYEVGYAHALGRIVLLLTQSADDIPFDLKHHQHIVYGGSIDKVKSQLIERIKWAINESRNLEITRESEQFEITVNEVLVPRDGSAGQTPTVMTAITGPIQPLKVVVRNIGLDASEAISHIYLFTQEASVFSVRDYRRQNYGLVQYLKARPSESQDGLTRLYRLPGAVLSLPPETFESLNFAVTVSNRAPAAGFEDLKLKLHTWKRSHAYRFRLAFQNKKKEV